ncbi:AraC family transcriptional regulator [Gelidibacter salicanalis]|uniref:Helix-turn-helix transcriptional regulator n=1 Tax=Gelidibacter salicanalis TaxID=291193 RepID=A0A934NHS1_9FLAO|nr:AraC family transcriptional regulator [Gelidibacter salicanalis]MBJ7880153.1 helix-turn-helix transcriptional regulator [Gelidibacter salicanalis]
MNHENKLRISAIHQMLLQLASSNFQYRIERSEHNDEIEGLVVTLNMLAEELGDSIVHEGLRNKDSEILDIVQMSFILDKNDLIWHASQKGLEILDIDWKDGDKRAFIEFLNNGSKKTWKEFRSLGEGAPFDMDMVLSLKTKSHLILPKKMYVSRMVGNSDNEELTVVTLIHHTTHQQKLQDELRDKVMKSKKIVEIQIEKTKFENPKRSVALTQEDIRQIRKARELISKYPEKSYSPIRGLAAKFGMNEFKLKYGFRVLYGVTVYKFHTDARLRKAQLMVQYSDIAIKNIAYRTGYKSPAHFSRTFKNKYGFSPSELRKN